MAKRTGSSKLMESMHSWWIEKLKEAHMDTENLKDPVEASPRDKYDTLSLDEINNKLWIKFGRIDHILSIGNKTQSGIKIYDFLPEKNYFIRFPTKPDPNKDDPKDMNDFCNRLQACLSDDALKKYFDLPLDVGFATEGFYGFKQGKEIMYQGLYVSAMTHDNLSKKGGFLPSFLDMWRAEVFSKTNKFLKDNKGICVLELEDVVNNSYTDVFRR